MESPTLLHTLNADVQGLLSDRLLEGTMDQLKRYPVYLLEHRINGKVKEFSCYCLGTDPKASLFTLIAHLSVECGSEWMGFLDAVLECSPLSKIYSSRPGLKSAIQEIMTGMKISGHVNEWADESVFYMLLLKYNLCDSCRVDIKVDDPNYLDMCIRDGHKILYPYLKVEDLLMILDLPGGKNSVIFRPMPLQVQHI